MKTPSISLTAQTASLTAMIVFGLASPALAAEFPLETDQAAVGSVDTYQATASDNLLDLARQNDIGYVNFIAANPGIDPWSPGEGRTITIPNLHILPDAPHKGIIVNLAARRVYYFPKGGDSVQTFPVGVGVAEGAMPLGDTKIVRKEDGPVWTPPPSIRAERPDLPISIGPGPNDPLGAYALRLGWTNILMHGTNKPDSVGRNVSHGCLHFYPEDIDALFHEVPVGTPVHVVSQPFEVAWINNRLYVEVYPNKVQADQIDYGQPMQPDVPDALMSKVSDVAGDRVSAVDWDAVEKAGEDASGLPVPVTGGSNLAAADAAASNLEASR